MATDDGRMIGQFSFNFLQFWQAKSQHLMEIIFILDLLLLGIKMPNILCQKPLQSNY